MFDLDAIEADWKEHCVCLSDKEIREIYIAEGVTTKAYDEERKKFINSLSQYHGDKSAAKEKLLRMIFFSAEESERKESTSIEKQKDLKQEPKRPYLSHESQMKVVEGSLDIVFKSVRACHDMYEKLPIEDLYYAALEGLFAAAKYCLHYTTKNCFRAYAKSFIRIQITKYIAKKEHITYRNAYCIESHAFDEWNIYAEENKAKYDVQSFSFDYDKEIPYKPSHIYEMIKEEYIEPDYTKKVSSEEFMADYTKSLQALSNDEDLVMSLSYDTNGNKGLTSGEISNILGVSKSKILRLKRSAIKKLRTSHIINKYR